MNRPLPRPLAAIAAITLVAAVLLAVSGCSRPPSPTRAETPATAPKPTTSATTTPAKAEATGSAAPMNSTNAGNVLLDVYLVQGEKLHKADRVVFGGRPKVAQAAMEQLLKGPSARERAGGLSTAIPAGTKLRGVTITNGVATVDLSGGFGDDAGLLGAQLRLGQVVYTLTQFPGVTGVVFALDGKRVDYFTGDGLDISKPQTRAGYEDLLPAVVIESVHDGQSVRSPLRVAGTANVFEAVFDLDVVDANGKVLVTKRVMATSGTGARGRFDVTLRFEAPSGGSGKVVAWYSSPKDGTRVVADEIAVDFER